MNRRQFIAAVAVAGLAGCTDPEPIIDVDRDIERQDSGIILRNLEVANGSDDCYHEYEGTIVNTTQETFTDIEITFHIYDKSGLLLSSVTLSYRLLRPEQIQEFSFTEEEECWDAERAVDYAIEVS